MRSLGSVAAAFGVIGVVLVAQQGPPPPGLYGAFRRGGPIVIGTITALDTTAHVVTLNVSEQLRGRLTSVTVTIPYETTPPDRRRPPMLWQRVAPVVGKRILVLLDRGEPPWRAAELLDLGTGEDRWLPILRRMIELEKPGPDARRRLLDAVSDPSDLIRALAIDQLLTVECVRDAGCKRTLLDAVFARATDRQAPIDDRLAAVHVIGLKIYDGSAADAPLNTTVLTDLFELAVSDSQPVREEAIQILSGYYFGPGLAKPAVPPLEPARRTQIRNALQVEAQRRGAFARQAADLAALLGER
jgi:hypothetical protein